MDKFHKRMMQLLGGVLILFNFIILMQGIESAKLDKMIEEPEEVKVHVITVPEQDKAVSRGDVNRSYEPTYVAYELPTEATGEFKTYMDYRTITDKSSKQWLLQQVAYTDENGFRKINGKYLVAVGTYFAQEVGKELRITLEDQTIIEVIVGDIKDDLHTDDTNRFIPINGNIVEFIVDTKQMSELALKLGSVSVLGLEGKIIKIEEEIK